MTEDVQGRAPQESGSQDSGPHGGYRRDKDPVDGDRRDGGVPRGGSAGGTVAARNVSELRDLRDPKTMRALAHPIRLQLLEALGLEGPLTATQAGELIGETPTTCSFHLRQLQKYGFVEDTRPRGTRERPWRLTRIGNRIPDWTGEPEVDLAAGALTKFLLERCLDRVRNWWAERNSYPPAWRDATGIHESTFFVTPEELTELMADIEPVLFRYLDRFEDATLRPPGALPVQMLVCSYLLRIQEGK
jgi:DNA-binding transcriptional ArsR family regulator